MIANGHTLTKARPIKNMLLTKEKEHGVSHGLSEAGYDTSSVPSAAMDAWIVVAERLAIVDDTAVRLARSFMELIASRHAGAAYDRWDAELTDDDGDVVESGEDDPADDTAGEDLADDQDDTEAPPSDELAARRTKGKKSRS